MKHNRLISTLTAAAVMCTAIPFNSNISQAAPNIPNGYSRRLASEGDIYVTVNSSGDLFQNGILTAQGVESVDIDHSGNLFTLGKDGRISKNGSSLGEGNYAALSCGDGFAIAVDTGGQLWGIGDNSKGQLGDGTVKSSDTLTAIDSPTYFNEVQCGSSFSVAIDKAGNIWEWGHNPGIDKKTDATTPKMLTDADYWVQVSCGQNHAAAIDSSGWLWTWGSGRYGQLGNGDTKDVLKPTRIGMDQTFNCVSCGSNYTVAIDSDGQVWACGNNSSGQLGNGSDKRSTTLVKISDTDTYSEVSAGTNTVIGLKNSGDIVRWGASVGNTPQVTDTHGEEQKYHIYFNSNGGTGTMPYQNKSYEKSEPLAANTFERTGYHFAGWSTSSTGSVEFSNTEAVTNLLLSGRRQNNSITLYAIWEANRYEMNFDCSLPSQIVDYGEMPTSVEIPTITKKVTLVSDGAELQNDSIEVSLPFKGFYDANGNQYFNSKGEASRPFDVAADINLHAEWGSKKVDLEIPGKAGYTFNGWTTDITDGTGVVSYQITDDVILYATWLEGSNNVIYNFKQNGGDSATETKLQADYGTKVDLSVRASKNGWNFVGWNTDPDATEGLRSLVMHSENITLYAIYSAPARIEFIDALGSRKVEQTLYNSEVEIDLEAPALREYSDWQPIGWTNTKDSDAILSSFTAYPGVSTQVYGVYSKDLMNKFIYSSDGNSSIMMTSHVVLNSYNIVNVRNVSITLPTTENVKIPDGWILVGWTTNQDSLTEWIESGTEVPVKTSNDWYAVLKRELHLGFDSGVSTISGEQYFNLSKYQNPTVVLPKASKDGYTFNGWLSGKSTVLLKEGSIYKFDSDETLTAKWSPIKYTVKFDGNGSSSGTTESQVMTYDEEAALQNNGFSRSFKIKLNPDGGDCEILDKTVEAVFNGWTLGQQKFQEHAVVKNLTSVGGSTVTLTADWGATSWRLPVPTKDGFTFLGWFEKGSEKPAGDTISPTKDTTLTAKWEAKKSKVTINTGITGKETIVLDTQVGREMPTVENLSKSCKITLNYGSLTKEDVKTINFTLDGIYDQKNGKGSKYYDGNLKSLQTWGENSSTTLYAYWKVKPIKVEIPTKVGYTFDGWYDGNIKLGDTYTPTGDATIILKYHPNTYKVKLNYKGGSASTDLKEYTFGEGATLPIPVKKDSTFVGWYDSDNNLLSAISNTQSGDISLTAKWVKSSGMVDSQDGNKDLSTFHVDKDNEIIPSNCFKDCFKLSTVTIDEGVVEVGANAFENCHALTEIVLPKTVLWVGKDAFKDCTKLKKIVIENPSCKIDLSENTIPKTSTVVGCSPSFAEQYAITNGNFFESDGKAALIIFNTDKEITNGYVKIGENLPAFIDVPLSVSDHDGTFKGYCLQNSNWDMVKKNTVIYNPNGELLISDKWQSEDTLTLNATWTKKQKKVTAFTSNGLKFHVNGDTASVAGTKSKKSKNIIIPASVKKNGKKYNIVSISANSFKSCTKLKKITVKSSKITSVGSNALKKTKKGLVIKVPKNKKKLYKKLFSGKGNKHIKIK